MRRLSLTARLALAFGLVAAIVFGGAGAYLYRALAMQVIERDDAELLRKVARARAELMEQGARPDSDWREVAGVVSGNDEFALVVRAAGGAVLLAANAGEGPPALPPVALDAQLGPEAIRAWTTRQGYPVHGVQALVPVGPGTAGTGAVSQTLAFTLYQTAISRTTLLRAYRARLLLTGLLGTLAVAGLGYLVLRAGMAPLRRIAAGASSVTVRRLELPIDPARLPPELAELAAALQQMMDRLRDGFERLSQFSADLAHDFRTPIGNLLGQSQVALSSERSADEYQALLASNIEEYERLARMIENMLFLARAENARVAVKPVRLDLARELGALSDYFEGLAEASGVAIAVDGGGAVLADPLLLRRAVSNLVANAIRYTPAGQTVVMAARTGPAGSRIEVRNPGAGIAPEHLPKLFDRFFRGDPARANSGESAGIGLAIVKSIMDLHHGHVEVESEVGGTTVFRLLFPASMADPAS
ncbi:heavy metal sensor histidine kinase [Cupriavidus basilensis]|uniref:heavy metal sensor histidine kinase n=1 Tax=Cupriavidus basilensis TaxID=68895 RepID=UPI0020A63F81|nr:heavy metal sensor histidine kinase [Cupriavidus basilensis]MCP3022724.1 heavy metal sensor histidine kinase [Cupriavidus basilensis]